MNKSMAKDNRNVFRLCSCDRACVGATPKCRSTNRVPQTLPKSKIGEEPRSLKDRTSDDFAYGSGYGGMLSVQSMEGTVTKWSWWQWILNQEDSHDEFGAWYLTQIKQPDGSVTEAKLNAAYANGGAELFISTIQNDEYPYWSVVMWWSIHDFKEWVDAEVEYYEQHFRFPISLFKTRRLLIRFLSVLWTEAMAAVLLLWFTHGVIRIRKETAGRQNVSVKLSKRLLKNSTLNSVKATTKKF